MVTIELSDVVFAVDSIPAIFAISKDPIILYTSNRIILNQGTDKSQETCWFSSRYFIPEQNILRKQQPEGICLDLDLFFLLTIVLTS